MIILSRERGVCKHAGCITNRRQIFRWKTLRRENRARFLTLSIRLYGGGGEAGATGSRRRETTRTHVQYLTRGIMSTLTNFSRIMLTRVVYSLWTEFVGIFFSITARRIAY